MALHHGAYSLALVLTVETDFGYIRTFMHHIVILTTSPSHVAPLSVTSCTLSSPSTTIGAIKGGLGGLGSWIVW